MERTSLPPPPPPLTERNGAASFTARKMDGYFRKLTGAGGGDDDDDDENHLPARYDMHVNEDEEKAESQMLEVYHQYRQIHGELLKMHRESVQVLQGRMVASHEVQIYQPLLSGTEGHNNFVQVTTTSYVDDDFVYSPILRTRLPTIQSGQEFLNEFVDSNPGGASDYDETDNTPHTQFVSLPFHTDDRHSDILFQSSDDSFDELDGAVVDVGAHDCDCTGNIDAIDDPSSFHSTLQYSDYFRQLSDPSVASSESTQPHDNLGPQDDDEVFSSTDDDSEEEQTLTPIVYVAEDIDAIPKSPSLSPFMHRHQLRAQYISALPLPTFSRDDFLAAFDCNSQSFDTEDGSGGSVDDSLESAQEENKDGELCGNEDMPLDAHLGAKADVEDPEENDFDRDAILMETVDNPSSFHTSVALWGDKKQIPSDTIDSELGIVLLSSYSGTASEVNAKSEVVYSADDDTINSEKCGKEQADHSKSTSDASVSESRESMSKINFDTGYTDRLSGTVGRTLGGLLDGKPFTIPDRTVTVLKAEKLEENEIKNIGDKIDVLAEVQDDNEFVELVLGAPDQAIIENLYSESMSYDGVDVTGEKRLSAGTPVKTDVVLVDGPSRVSLVENRMDGAFVPSDRGGSPETTSAKVFKSEAAAPQNAVQKIFNSDSLPNENDADEGHQVSGVNSEVRSSKAARTEPVSDAFIEKEQDRLLEAMHDNLRAASPNNIQKDEYHVEKRLDDVLGCVGANSGLDISDAALEDKEPMSRAFGLKKGEGILGIDLPSSISHEEELSPQFFVVSDGNMPKENAAIERDNGFLFQPFAFADRGQVGTESLAKNAKQNERSLEDGIEVVLLGAMAEGSKSEVVPAQAREPEIIQSRELPYNMIVKAWGDVDLSLPKIDQPEYVISQEGISRSEDDSNSILQHSGIFVPVRTPLLGDQAGSNSGVVLPAIESLGPRVVSVSAPNILPPSAPLFKRKEKTVPSDESSGEVSIEMGISHETDKSKCEGMPECGGLDSDAYVVVDPLIDAWVVSQQQDAKSCDNVNDFPAPDANQGSSLSEAEGLPAPDPIFKDVADDDSFDHIDAAVDADINTKVSGASDKLYDDRDPVMIEKQIIWEALLQDIDSWSASSDEISLEPIPAPRSWSKDATHGSKSDTAQKLQTDVASIENTVSSLSILQCDVMEEADEPGHQPVRIISRKKGGVCISSILQTVLNASPSMSGVDLSLCEMPQETNSGAKEDQSETPMTAEMSVLSITPDRSPLGKKAVKGRVSSNVPSTLDNDLVAYAVRHVNAVPKTAPESKSATMREVVKSGELSSLSIRVPVLKRALPTKSIRTNNFTVAQSSSAPQLVPTDMSPFLDLVKQHSELSQPGRKLILQGSADEQSSMASAIDSEEFDCTSRMLSDVVKFADEAKGKNVQAVTTSASRWQLENGGVKQDELPLQSSTVVTLGDVDAAACLPNRLERPYSAVTSSLASEAESLNSRPKRCDVNYSRSPGSVGSVSAVSGLTSSPKTPSESIKGNPPGGGFCLPGTKRKMRILRPRPVANTSVADRSLSLALRRSDPPAARAKLPKETTPYSLVIHSRSSFSSEDISSTSCCATEQRRMSRAISPHKVESSRYDPSVVEAHVCSLSSMRSITTAGKEPKSLTEEHHSGYRPSLDAPTTTFAISSNISRFSSEGHRVEIAKKRQQSLECKGSQYDSHIHAHADACYQCWVLASQEERQKFVSRGSALCITKTRGGCSCGSHCKVFSEKEVRGKIHLCCKCYFNTHATKNRRLQCYRGNYQKIDP